jgi:hypothetical protein
MGEKWSVFGCFCLIFRDFGRLGGEIWEGGIFGLGRDFGMAMEGGMGVE